MVAICIMFIVQTFLKGIDTPSMKGGVSLCFINGFVLNEVII